MLRVKESATPPFPYKLRPSWHGPRLSHGISTMALYIYSVYIIACYTSCMDPLPTPPEINFEKVYLKFETNLRHRNNTYGIEILIPYNYILSVSHEIFNYHSYLQTTSFERKVIISFQRRDGERINKYIKDLSTAGSDMALLQTIKTYLEFITVTLIQHIDDFLVPYINIDEHLMEIRSRFASIEGVWKKEFSWAKHNLKEVLFSGIYLTDSYSELNDITSGTLVFMAFYQNNKITKVVDETEFQVIYKLLDAIHKDLIKNNKLNHYLFLVARMVQQSFKSKIYIHKKCINVLRVLGSEQKDKQIMTIDMDSIDISLPNICYFNLLGTVLDRFRTALYIEYFKDNIDELSALVGEYPGLVGLNRPV